MAVAKKATPSPRKTASVKSAPGKSAKPAAKTAAVPGTGIGTKPGAEKPGADKPRKAKLVRDSFTIPKAEYKVIEDTKVRAATLGRPVKKSEILRAGLKALAGLGDAAFIAALGAVPALKTGRPARP